MTHSRKQELDVNGRKVLVSNLEKVLYPKVGFTKAQVIDYYIRVAPVLLPHLRERPVTLKRYPEGVEGFFFYEKQCPSHRPQWIKTARVSSKENRDIHYCVMNDLPALLWAANLADLELHTFLHCAPAMERPTVLAFDLDPGPPANLLLCCQVALWIKELLDSLGMKSFPKTSGSKGLQVFVPLNTSAVTYSQTKPWARALAEHLEREHPETIVSRMQKPLRRGKVLIDWSQNDDHKTTVSVYSLRAKSEPTVSTPVTWAEITRCLKAKAAERLRFLSEEVLSRIEKQNDLFADVLTLKQRLPPLSSIVHPKRGK